MVYLAAKRPPYLEPEVILAAKCGDEHAFEGLYRIFSPMVDMTALRIVGDLDDACDISQDTWLKAYIMLPNLRELSFFPSWLHRIAVNTSLQHIRHQKRIANRHAHEACSCTDNHDLLPGIDIARFLAALPPRMRQVVKHRLAGDTLRQAALEMMISEGTAKSQLHKARIRLTPLLRRSAQDA